VRSLSVIPYIKRYLSIFNFLIEYVGAPYPTVLKSRTERLKAYIKAAFFIALAIFANTNFMGFPLIFTVMYPWIFILVVFSSCFVTVEVIKILFYKDGRFYERLTIGKVWGIMFLGLVIGFFPHHYISTSLFVDHVNGINGSVFSSGNLFIKVLLTWPVFMFFLIEIQLKKQYLIDNEKVNDINKSLTKQNRELVQKHFLNCNRKTEQSEGKGREDTRKSINGSITIDNTKQEIDINTVSHISIEDHYARFFLCLNDQSEEILTRMSLKQALEKLPAFNFVQIHRSHVVNLQFASRIEKDGRDYNIVLNPFNKMLPVSRYRLPTIFPRLKMYLDS